jgi:hypothetical protein
MQSHAADEARVLRQRVQSLADDLDRLHADDGEPGAAVLCKIQSAGGPGPRAYMARAVTLDVAEAEGATPTFVEVGDQFAILQLNPAAVPTGSVVLAEQVGGRFVFTY